MVPKKNEVNSKEKNTNLTKKRMDKKIEENTNRSEHLGVKQLCKRFQLPQIGFLGRLLINTL